MRSSEPRDGARLFRELDRRFSLSRLELVFGWSLDLPAEDELSSEVLEDAQSVSTSPLLSVFRALPPTSHELPKSIILLTRGGQSLKEGAAGTNPACGMVIGLGRSMVSENPNMKVRLVDLAPSSYARESRDLLAEIRSSSDEEEVALRSSGRMALRFRRKELAQTGRSGARHGHRLEILTPGMLDSMTFIETPAGSPVVERSRSRSRRRRSISAT